jgi:hypothetical protein
MPQAHTLEQEQLEALAKKAQCDERTLTRYLAGLRVYPLSQQRIEWALSESGMDKLIRRKA